MQNKIVKKSLIVSVIILFGIVISFILIKTRPKPKQHPKEQLIIKVKTISILPKKHNVIIDAMGLVSASHRIKLKSRVTGDIIEINKNLIPGARIKQNEIFAEIDNTDYKLALHQAEANIAEAKQRLLQEEGRQEIAKQEWQLIGLSKKASQLEKQLALRKPQLEAAKANLKAAEAKYQSALRDLQYCQLRLPFNALIISKNIDVGSRVNQNSVIADVVNSNTFWITAKVPVSALKWINLPDKNHTGSKVNIIQHTGTTDIIRLGTVIKYLPILEKEGRMALVLIEIKDPLALNNKSLQPLLIGSFVRLEIIGKIVKNSFKIPRSATHLGSTIWIAKPDNTLEIRTYKKLWGTRSFVLIDNGLNAQDKIINSYIPFPINGLKVKIDAE